MDIVLRVVQPAEDVAITPTGIGPIGDSRADGWFDALFQTHYPRVVGMLTRLMGDRGQAEEIAADAFCKLAKQTPDGLGEGHAAWVYRVAMNAGLDAVRSNSRRKKREESVGAEDARRTEPGALDLLLLEERRARVWDVLSALKPRDAQMLLLRSGGMSYREVAQSMDIQPGSVGTLLARAEAEFERRYRARYGAER